MSDFSEEIPDIQQTIAENGEACLYFARTESTPLDVSKPWKVSGTFPPAAGTGVPVSVVFVSASGRGSTTEGRTAKFVGRTDVLAGNKRGLMAGGVDLVPTAGDVIYRTASQTTALVMGVEDVNPAGVELLYKLDLFV